MLDLFAGSWSFLRHIDDRLDGGRTEVEGTVRLTRDGEGLTWDEAGAMRRPDGTVLRVGRRYLWRAAADGGIAVLFADGRPFHVFHPGGEGEVAVHHCAADRYLGRYAFDLPERWQVAWQVTGPRKDYVSTTAHHRLR